MEIFILKGHKFPEIHGLCVVIDVLRAFTTAAFAFGAGAKEITFVSSIEEAFSKHQSDSTLLLMGEREGEPIEGFHFSNSPKELRHANLAGKRLVQRTSSGTQGVIGCCHASHILAASFVIAEATIKRILELNPPSVFFIVTGRNNGDEDLALAEYLRDRLKGMPINLEHSLQRVRTSPAAQRMLAGPISYDDGSHDLKLAQDVDCFSFAIEVHKEGENLVGRAVAMCS
jgi:2-phosphosulfolactate phosphatase